MKTPTSQAKKRINARIGREVHRLRTVSGMSQTQLSRVMGVDQSAMSRIELGMQCLSAVQWFALCAHLGISSDTLVKTVQGSKRRASS